MLCMGTVLAQETRGGVQGLQRFMENAKCEHEMASSKKQERA